MVIIHTYFSICSSFIILGVLIRFFILINKYQAKITATKNTHTHPFYFLYYFIQQTTVYQYYLQNNLLSFQTIRSRSSESLKNSNTSIHAYILYSQYYQKTLLNKMPNRPEYGLVCKRFLRIFGLYYFKNDKKLRRYVTNVWMFSITFLFLLTALQALYQQLRRKGFIVTRDLPGTVTFCIKKYNTGFLSI